MFLRICLLVSIPALLVGACDLDAKHENYVSAYMTGVTDCARGGYTPDNSTCFSYCPTTTNLFMNVKVLLANTPTLSAKLNSRKFQKSSGADSLPDDDMNEITCVNAALRQQLNQILSSVNDYSCKGIVRALVFGLNRPKWQMSCYTGGVGGEDALSDDNFCYYDAELNGARYTLTLAAVDTS